MRVRARARAPTRQPGGASQWTRAPGATGNCAARRRGRRPTPAPRPAGAAGAQSYAIPACNPVHSRLHPLPLPPAPPPLPPAPLPLPRRRPSSFSSLDKGGSLPERPGTDPRRSPFVGAGGAAGAMLPPRQSPARQSPRHAPGAMLPPPPRATKKDAAAEGKSGSRSHTNHLQYYTRLLDVCYAD